MSGYYKVYRQKKGSPNLWPQPGEFSGGLESATREALEQQPLKEGKTETVAVLNLGRDGGMAIFEASYGLTLERVA